MARPKGKLFALLAIFAAIGIVTATGAFTSVSAERTVDVNVAGDSAALLALAPNSSSANGDYAVTTSNQLELEINTTNSNQGTSFQGEGVNDNAYTNIDHVFNITNQGTQQVEISVNTNNLPDGITLYVGNDETQNLGSATPTLSTGNTLSVGVRVDTVPSSDDGDPAFPGGSDTITIQANATA